MATSVQTLLGQIRTVLDSPTHYGTYGTTYASASNHLASAISDLNFSGCPVINLKLTAAPTYTLAVDEEV